MVAYDGVTSMNYTHHQGCRERSTKVEENGVPRMGPRTAIVFVCDSAIMERNAFLKWRLEKTLERYLWKRFLSSSSLGLV